MNHDILVMSILVLAIYNDFYFSYGYAIPIARAFASAQYIFDLSL